MALVRTQIQLTQEQDRQLEQLAAAGHVSKAELVRQAVDHLLRQNGQLQSEREKRQRAMSIIGMFSSGLSDVSARHDDYLAESYADYKR